MEAYEVVAPEGPERKTTEIKSRKHDTLAMLTPLIKYFANVSFTCLIFAANS